MPPSASRGRRKGRRRPASAARRASPLVRSDGHRDAIDEENRIFAVYCARHRIDWRDFHRMGAAEVGLLRAEALANRHLYPIPVSEPGYLYHGTSKARLAHIKCQGLLPSERMVGTGNLSSGTGRWARCFSAPRSEWQFPVRSGIENYGQR